MDEILEAARRRTLIQIDAELERACAGRSHLNSIDLEQQRRLVMRSDWQPPRPSRRMPSLWLIYSYWAEREEFGDALGKVSPVPHCFGCGVSFWRIKPEAVPEVRWNAALGWLERAHLITRHKGGLDYVHNIVPLCHPCHKLMPRFTVEQGPEAIKWVQDGGRLGLPEVHAKIDARLVGPDLSETRDRKSVV